LMKATRNVFIHSIDDVSIVVSSKMPQ